MHEKSTNSAAYRCVRPFSSYQSNQEKGSRNGHVDEICGSQRSNEKTSCCAQARIFKHNHNDKNISNQRQQQKYRAYERFQDNTTALSERYFVQHFTGHINETVEYFVPPYQLQDSFNSVSAFFLPVITVGFL